MQNTVSSVEQVIHNTTEQLATVINNKFHTTVQLTTVEVDLLFEDLTGLVNQQFKPWYCKQFYRLGYSRVLELASLAKSDAREPAKYFSRLLKSAK